MKYILSKEEHDALVPKADLEAMTEKRDVLVQIALAILKVADRGELCIHDPDEHDEGCCDTCPLAEGFPPSYADEVPLKVWAALPEEIRKKMDGYVIHQLCGLPRNWSK